MRSTRQLSLHCGIWIFKIMENTNSVSVRPQRNLFTNRSHPDVLFYSILFFFLILKPWITLSSPNIPRTFISVEPHLWNFLLDSKHFFLFLFSAVIAKQFHQVASSAQIIPFLCTEGHSSFCWAVPWSLVIVLMSVLLCRTPVFQTQRKVYFHLFCT